MLKSNKVNLLISVVCAIVLWMYITIAVNPETERTIGSVPVTLINIDALNDRGFTVGEGMTYLVDITVTGSRSDVGKLTASDFRAAADMTGYRRGESQVPVNVIMPNNIELVQLRPDTILVTVVDLVTVTKPVRLEFEDKFADGTEAGFVSVLPGEMEVSGVAEVVDSIEYIRARVPKGSLSEEATTLRLDVTAINKAGQAVYNVGLSQNQVEVTAAVLTAKRVPLVVGIIGDASENIEITNMSVPSFITVRGAAAAVAGITQVEAQTINLAEIIDTVEIPIEPSLPDGVEIADASAGISVKIEVQGIVKKTLEYTAEQIAVANLAAGLSGHVNTGSVTVDVLAPADVSARLLPSDIVLSVDAAEQSKAGSSIEMEVVADCAVEGVKSIVVTPAKVRVTIIKGD